MSKAVMQQALEVLKNLQGGCTDSGDGTVEAITVWCPEVIEALEQALAEPEQPVAHLWQHSETGRTRVVMPDQVITADATWFVVGPLYLGSAPTPRKPLTYDELEPLCEAFDSYDTTQNELVEFARAIERAHGITGESK